MKGLHLSSSDSEQEVKALPSVSQGVQQVRFRSSVKDIFMGTAQTLFLRRLKSTSLRQETQAIESGMPFFGMNADVGFSPFLICLLIEGNLPVMTVGAFLSMPW